jgi:hypothetical protein
MINSCVTDFVTIVYHIRGLKSTVKNILEMKMDISVYIAIGVIVLTVALGFVSTMRFNRKKPMTYTEYEEYEREKKKYKEDKK